MLGFRSAEISACRSTGESQGEGLSRGPPTVCAPLVSSSTVAPADARPTRSSSNAVSIPHEVHRLPSDAPRPATAAVSVEASLVRPARTVVQSSYGSQVSVEPANATRAICVALSGQESSWTRAVSTALTEASSDGEFVPAASKTITMSWGCRQGQVAAAARDSSASMAGNCGCMRERALAVLTG
eukprot:scaffold65868_cov63-Phaeocystis_antarctica.AAC.3